MALRAVQRGFANKIKKVPNINVNPHNVERRPGLTGFNFTRTFNMGYETFSTPLKLARMHPVWGMKGEYFALLALFAAYPLVHLSRKKKERKLRSLVTTNNRYAMLNLSEKARQPSKWTL